MTTTVHAPRTSTARRSARERADGTNQTSTRPVGRLVKFDLLIAALALAVLLAVTVADHMGREPQTMGVDRSPGMATPLVPVRSEG